MGILMCTCGGVFRQYPDLVGLCCDSCGALVTGDYNKLAGVDDSKTLDDAFSEERARVVRGVSMSEISIGTESKGKICIKYPPYLSPSEQKQLIDSQLDVLEYTKKQVATRGMDIYSSRGKGV